MSTEQKINAFGTVRATGGFFMQVIDVATGKVLSEIHENNLVVLIGKTNLSKLLAGDAAGKAVTQISVGTNGSDPVDADASITAPFSKAFDSISYPDLQTTEFNFTILDTEANGMTIREAGLLLSNASLFARKKVQDITKTSLIKLVGIWKIKFS